MKPQFDAQDPVLQVRIKEYWSHLEVSFIEYTSFTFLHVSSISRRLPLEELTLLDHRGGDENIYIDMKLWSTTLDITLIACS